jgi:hypothetical protein
MAAQSDAWNDIVHSNTKIIGSNPTQSMDIICKHPAAIKILYIVS